jgi:hypothetical protein
VPATRLVKVLVVESLITCPLCATQVRETMPGNACQHFYLCTGCGQLLKPRDGDCCVFCSYGDVPCPPKQGESDECDPHRC